VRDFDHLSHAKTPLYKGFSEDYVRDDLFFRENLLKKFGKRLDTKYGMYLDTKAGKCLETKYGLAFIPTVGMLHPQCGDTTFPAWEWFVTKGCVERKCRLLKSLKVKFRMFEVIT
jgi:hypothetical protein